MGLRSCKAVLRSPALNAKGTVPVRREVQNSTAKEYANKSDHCRNSEPGMPSLPVALRASTC